jgi:hypothetical protein
LISLIIVGSVISRYFGLLKLTINRIQSIKLTKNNIEFPQASNTPAAALRKFPQAPNTSAAALRIFPQAPNTSAAALRMFPQAPNTTATTLRKKI